MNGGTPYEKDVEVEASVTRGCKNRERTAEKKQFILVFCLHLKVALYVQTSCKQDVKQTKKNLSLSSPVSSSWCFPADASGQAAAQTDREGEISQQPDQNAAQV